MSRTYNFPRQQQGMTLIELSVAIIVGLVLLAVAIGGISSTMSKSDINAEAQGMTGIIANAKTLRAGGSYGASGTNLVPSLIALKGVPSTVTVNGTNLANQWGGTVTVTSTGPGYVVSTADVPQDACIELATTLSKTMMSTSINGGAGIAGQVSTAQATTACSGTGNTNSVAWTTAS